MKKQKKMLLSKKTLILLIFKDFFAAEIGRKNAEHTFPKFHILSKIQFLTFWGLYESKSGILPKIAHI